MSEYERPSRKTWSRDHVDHHLRRERRAVEALSSLWGTEVVRKLDRPTLRDVLYERKQKSLDGLFAREDEEAETDRGEPRIRSVVQLRHVRRDWSVVAPARGLREQRRVRRELELSGRLAVSRLEQYAREEGVEVEQTLWLTASAVLALTIDDLRRFASREDVVSVTNDKLAFVDCLDVSRPLIGADQVEAMGFDGTGVTVAVIDSGVDAAHPALVGVVVSQQDFTGEGTGDLHGHGTHCAGIIASQDRTRRGVAPGAQIADIKIGDMNWASSPTIAVSGVTAAVSAGVQVASCSWGWTHADGLWSDPTGEGTTDDSCQLCTAVNGAVASGVVMCVAAGNEDNDSCATYDTHIRCPGNARSAITVGATDDSDMMASFSSVGPTPQGRQKPDLCAPGTAIASCRASGTSMGSVIDADWTDSDGTSMACPHVAGVAALMLQKNASLTPANVMAAMIATVVNIGAPAEQMGAGRIDALAAVNAV
jgi:serine protease AprX